MPTREASHVLLDFFGTLVEYSPSRTAQGYELSFSLLQKAGAALDYQEFLALWSVMSSQFDASAEKSHREFSMVDLGAAFLRRAIGPPTGDLVRDFVRTYISEWNKGVCYIEGVSDLLERLARRFTLAVVTNTHDPDLVPHHLERMGVSHLFRRVVTSVEHGIRKPAPDIFHDTLRALGVSSEESIYVGDSYDADYRGARSAGIRAFLIDPRKTAPIPDIDRLDSIFALEHRLQGVGV